MAARQASPTSIPGFRGEHLVRMTFESLLEFGITGEPAASWEEHPAAGPASASQQRHEPVIGDPHGNLRTSGATSQVGLDLGHRAAVKPAQDEALQGLGVRMSGSGHRHSLLGIDRRSIGIRSRPASRKAGAAPNPFTVPQKSSTRPAAFSRNRLRTRDLAIRTALTDRPSSAATSEAGSRPEPGAGRPARSPAGIRAGSTPAGSG